MNKKIFFICSLFLCIPFLGNAQNVYWNKTFDIGGDTEVSPKMVCVDSNVYTLHTYDKAGYNFLLVGLSKFDLHGNLIWTKEFKEEGYNLSNNWTLSTVGSVICFTLTRHGTEPYSKVHYLIKTDLNGDTLKYKKFETSSNHRFMVSKILKDGSILMSGYKKEDTTTYRWVFQKVNAQGNVIWKREFPWNSGATNVNDGNDIDLTPDGGFVLGGWSSGYDSTKLIQGMVIKTDSLGKIEWVKDYGNKWYESRFDVAVVDSFIYVSGKINVDGDDLYPWEGKLEAFLGKYELDGSIVFEKFFGPPTGNRGFINGLFPLKNGDILAHGSHPDISGFKSGLLFRLSSDGDSIWSRYHDYLPTLKNVHIIHGVAELSDGSIVTAGQMVPHPKYYDSVRPALWLMRVDAMGCEFAGCDTVCITPEIKLNFEVLPDLKVKASFSPPIDYPNLVFAEPNIQWELFEDTVGIYTMSAPGELEIFAGGEGPCNLPVRWDTTINVDYVGTSEIEEEFKVTIYPNPASDFIKVSLPHNGPSNHTYNLTSLDGRAIMSGALPPDGTISLSDLSSGVYLLQLYDGEGVLVGRERFVKE